MATVNNSGTNYMRFTPSTAVTGVPTSSAVTFVVVAQPDGTGSCDIMACIEGTTSIGGWYHSLQSVFGSGLVNLFDDDGLVGVSSGSLGVTSTSDWWVLAV